MSDFARGVAGVLSDFARGLAGALSDFACGIDSAHAWVSVPEVDLSAFAVRLDDDGVVREASVS